MPDGEGEREGERGAECGRQYERKKDGKRENERQKTVRISLNEVHVGNVYTVFHFSVLNMNKGLKTLTECIIVRLIVIPLLFCYRADGEKSSLFSLHCY